ncbi:hypothetical protein [Paraglaciecola sp.]|uniref:hypothetical protein n=1 Tax=Paraglaciecola sp. TaxID=1920173 RepID=UPI003EF59D42
MNNKQTQGFWSPQELTLPPLSNSQVFKSNRYKAGEQAVQAVESRVGTLPERYRRVIRDEGFVEGGYYDDKGILTAGMGQTGEYINQSPVVAIKEKEAKAAMLVDGYDNYDEATKGALLSASYRGDMSAGDKWLGLFNSGDYDAAAKELLNHKEYKERKKVNPNDGVVKRLEDIASKIKNAMYDTDNANVKED